MKVIDQINGSAIFAKSAYSASIATKDNLGRDITATYLTAHQPLDNYLTTADANTISSTLSGAITALSGEVPQLSAGEGIDISTVDGKTVITNNISAGQNISLVYDMETNTYRIDSTGGSTGEYVPLASSVVPYAGEIIKSNYDVSSVNYYTSAHFSNIDTSNQITVTPYSLEASGTYSSNGGYSKQHTSIKPRMIYTEQSANDGERFSIGIYHRERMDTDTSAEPYTYFGESYSSGTNYEGLMFDERRVKRTSISNNVTSTNSATWDQILNAATAEGQYVPLSAKNCTIGNANSAGIGDWGATADNSFAQGDSNSAYAHSFVQGNRNSACWQSMAQGERNKSFNQSMTQGTTNSAVDYSQALGDENTASYYSFAAGNRNFASRHSQALGYKLNISGGLASGGMAIGSCNKLSSDVSFVVGNGTSTANRSDAFVIYPDGRVSAAGKISANGVELCAGKTYTGVAPIQVNNTTDEISITGESLSAGPGIDMFSSGGYVVVSSTGKELSAGPGIDLFESGGYFVISSNGAGGSTFPITGTNGTTGFTANMDCSSMMLTTGASPAGGYVKHTVRGVQYEAYPATDVSASWYNIINATNNRSNCYCIRFTNDLTAAYLENYSAYDKVTVVHSNQYTPNCELYWNGNTKVFPSGLYCELVKGTNDQNETDWFFTTSGWINNLEWDWD